MTFSTFGLHPALLRAVEQLGFAQPTPIQQQAIPPAMDGRDVMACAMTGSGKTAAFLLPILQRVIDKPRGTTRALVISPTRELAAQTEKHFAQLAVGTKLTAASVFGGVAPGPQEQAFRRGVDVLIATPGRLLDHLKQPYARLDQLEVLVLDEADRMLDMGFLPDIRRVLSHLPAKRQTMFFSATMPAPIIGLARDMLVDPIAVNLERKSLPATGVSQAVYAVSEDLKPALFLELIHRGTLADVIVFTRTKHRANRLAEVLERGGVRVARIHGNRSQAQRNLALDGFKRGEFQVLVATDIVARGIDVEDLSHVVNFDVPHVPEDYIHRVGRTARADATGDAYTFVSKEEEGDLRAIERAIGRQIPRLIVEGFDYKQKATQRFEVPAAERIAAIRARRADERKRSAEKASRRNERETQETSRRGGQGATSPSRSSRGSTAPRSAAVRSAGARPKGEQDAAHAHPAAAHAHHEAEAPYRDASARGASPARTAASTERVRGAWSPAREASAAAEPRRPERSRGEGASRGNGRPAHAGRGTTPESRGNGAGPSRSRRGRGGSEARRGAGGEG